MRGREHAARFVDVTYQYPGRATPAIQNESWTIARGSFSLVVGPSGGGKSTALRCLNGLIPHFSGGVFGGTVLVGDRDTRDSGPRSFSQQVGFVFQDPEAQLVTDRVDNEIAFGLEQHGVDSVTMRKRVEEALDYLGLAALRERHPRDLSGGERQRVAIAAALATHPEIVVLDEPTSQLDPWSAEDVLAVLSRLNDDIGMTVVVSEHRLERLLDRADLVRHMPGGGLASISISPHQFAQTTAATPLPPVTRLGQALNLELPPLTVKQARAVYGPLPGKGPVAKPAAHGDVVCSLSGLRLTMGGQTILDELDLEIQEGELVALMGRNGVGKTTLLRAMAGLQPVEHGSVLACGMDLRREPAESLAGQVGYVPQHATNLFFRERLAEELTFTAKSRGVNINPGSTLAQFGLAGKEETHPLDLSGGERERAALATVMAGQPRLLLLDEPTRGMDAWQKHTLATVLEELRRSGVAIVLATHDVELVAECASRVVMLGDRNVVADGHPRAVLTDSLAYTTQINKVFGGSWLTVDDILQHIGGSDGC